VRSLISVLLVGALTLALLAGVTLGLGDRQVLTSPPEAVVEQFARKLQTRRFHVALEHLDEDLIQKTTPEELGAATAGLEGKVGRIEDVRGEPGTVQGDTAEADAVLTVAGGEERPVRFRLQRRHGAWAIGDLGDLAGGG
jgi:hypothetical protein